MSAHTLHNGSNGVEAWLLNALCTSEDAPSVTMLRVVTVNPPAWSLEDLIKWQSEVQGHILLPLAFAEFGEEDEDFEDEDFEDDDFEDDFEEDDFEDDDFDLDDEDFEDEDFEEEVEDDDDL